MFAAPVTPLPFNKLILMADLAVAVAPEEAALVPVVAVVPVGATIEPVLISDVPEVVVVVVVVEEVVSVVLEVVPVVPFFCHKLSIVFQLITIKITSKTPAISQRIKYDNHFGRSLGAVSSAGSCVFSSKKASRFSGSLFG